MTVVNASGSMFQNASNFAIHGGTFIIVCELNIQLPCAHIQDSGFLVFGSE
ncbi:hypothetical protein GYMLUDRAFT_916587 [Collybiopsis luxurians FD-317 M1]|uniref:Uncharacterized protein n=1 Tax=Collybiopsis luxurians FD-317 M1 TaxID=944289 RepID=A0A0D0C8G9_9AGAR|nr:hypothetical protein GYMLUDRAFT_916587 [Collybiopsis luxurians FD-317 M1]